MRTTIRDIQRLKETGQRIPMLTAYDYTMAPMLDAAGIPMLLVGDSLGMVVLGYDSTVPVTIDYIIHHVRPVVRGSQSALIVGDLPFLTYTSPEQALMNAGRLLQEGGCQAVKLEELEIICNRDAFAFGRLTLAVEASRRNIRYVVSPVAQLLGHDTSVPLFKRLPSLPPATSSSNGSSEERSAAART